MNDPRSTSRRTVVAISLIGPVLIAGIAIAFYLGRTTKSDPPQKVIVSSTGPTIEQLQSMGELVVMKAAIADILVGEGEGYKGSWMIKGDGLVAVDIRKAKISGQEPTTKKLIISLPQPRVIQPRVDHEKTKTWEVVKTTWVPFGGNPDKLRDTVMLQAQKLVEETCRKKDIMNSARDNTVLLLKHMYEFIGWNVEVRWDPEGESEDPTQKEKPNK